MCTLKLCFLFAIYIKSGGDMSWERVDNDPVSSREDEGELEKFI